MKITEILQAYHTMPACDRLDLICRMLRHCIPYEVRFLGTILLDEARSHFKAYISKMEASANRVNYYSSMNGLTHEVCEKLCCALAVLHADNRPVAETIFNILNDSRVMTHFEEANDLRVMQDFRLLYVMAVNHPALSFNQRQHLMYTYLRRMDSVFIDKCKYSFSGSFSNSIEKTLSCELDGGVSSSGKYPPEGHFKDISPDAYIVKCEVHSVYKRTTDKRYAYMIQVEWSDGTSYTVRRTYGDFFSFQTKLLDLFPEEGGQKGKKHPRLIPFLPGKNYSKFLKNRDVAEKRLPELQRYSRELISLPDHVTRSPHVLEFFRPKPTDMKEDYPAFHKITTLYDLIESGKVRPRVLSEPMKGGGSSPAPHHSSPLQRAAAAASASDTSPPSASRTSHTLPPVPSTSTQQVSHEVTPIIPRRPTFPLTRHLQKSETSAFTPVGQSTLSADDLVSTDTLTASIISIPGTGPNQPTSPTFPTTTPTFLKATPTLTEHSTSAKSFVFSSSNESSKSASTVEDVLSPSSSEAVRVSASSGHSGAESEGKRGMAEGRGGMAEGEEPHHQVTNSVPVAGGVVSNSTTAQQTMALWRQIQMSMAPGNQAMGVSLGSVMSPPLSSISPTQQVTSPISATLNSPLLATYTPPSLAPPITSPSPTHSGASTPRSCTVAPYPQQIIYPPYYLIGTSPLPSPLASPKANTKWRGSYNQGVNECDSLLKWLKSLRLHKYHSKFEKLTYEELCQMSADDFESKGMTTGAAKKLHKKLEELKSIGFIGFRDMPFAGGMVRKLSTCSLPASLLMEQVGLTPSSSYECFSPTGSTCSLDKFGQGPTGGVGVRTLTPNQSKQHHSTHEMRTREYRLSQGETPSTIMPVLLNGIPGGGGVASLVGRTSSMSSATSTPESKRNSDPPVLQGVVNTSVVSSAGFTPSAAVQVIRTSTPGSGKTDGSGKGSRSTGKAENSGKAGSAGKTEKSEGGARNDDSGQTHAASDSPDLSNTSWADTGEEGGGAVSRPDWAVMPGVNGVSGTGSRDVASSFHSGTGMRDSTQSHSSTTSQTSTGSVAVSRAIVGSVSPPSHSSNVGTRTRPSNPQVHSGMDPAGYHVSRAPLSAPHTPVHGHHGHHAHHHLHHGYHHSSSTGKRHSHHEGGVAHDPSAEIIVPQPVHPVAAGRNAKPVHPYVYPAVVRVPSQQQRPQQRVLYHGGVAHVHHNQNNSSANGLMRTPMSAAQNRLHAGGVGVHLFPPTHGGVVSAGGVVYSSSPATGHTSHHQAPPPPPVQCYNCGKRGHLGSTCPGVTMDVTDNSSFHKQLDRAVNGKAAL